jgi:hypothetical protein
VAHSWIAATHAGASDSSPSILDFMSLYNTCVTISYAARVSVNRTTGYQDVTLFCRFPTQTMAKINRKRRRRRQCCPSTTITACAPTASAPADCAQPAYALPTADSPLPKSPPAKRTRKRRYKVELFRDGEEDSSLLVPPLSYETSSPFSPPPPSPLLPTLLVSTPPQSTQSSPSPSKSPEIIVPMSPLSRRSPLS